MGSIRSTFLVLAALALLLSGCLSPPQTDYCCDMATAQLGYCKVITTVNGQPYTEDYKGKSTCDILTGKCDVMKEILDSAGKPTGKDEEVTLPICTEKIDVPCISGSCTAMVCGPINYVPNPFKGQKTAEELYSDTSATLSGNPSGAFASLGNDAAKLYQGTCKFIPVDNFFKYVFENTEGAYVNTFRFGTGDSIQAYERSWPYFPISDYYCGSNSNGFVDRYMNYLADQSYFDSYLKTYHANKPSIIKPFIQSDACLMSSGSQIDLHTTTYGGNAGEYLYYTDEHDESVQTGVDKDKDPVYLDYTAPQNTVIDADFYAKALRFLYDQDIKAKGKAPYECEGPMDCMAGSCGTGTYSRSVCAKVDGTYAECLCGQPQFGTDSFYMDCVSKAPAQYASNNIQLSRQAIEDVSAFSSNLPAKYCKEGMSAVDCMCDPSQLGADESCPQPPATDVTAKIRFMEFSNEQLAAMKSGLTLSSLPNAIGFSDSYSFSSTALAKGCGMVEGIDYKTYSLQGPLAGVPGASGYVSFGIDAETGDPANTVPAYPLKYTLILSLGKCSKGELMANAPSVKQFGWCEPCTFSTMSRFSVTSKDDDYVAYRQGQSISYLQRDVLPVVTFTSDIWEEIDNRVAPMDDIAKDDTVFMKQFLENNGPYIVVVGDFQGWSDMLPSEEVKLRDAITKKRAEYVKKSCDRCLTAFQVSEKSSDFPDKTESWNSQFLKNRWNARALFAGYNGATTLGFKGCYDELGKPYPDSDPLHCDKDMLNYVDILLFDFYPHDVTSDDKYLCTKDETQYDAVMKKAEEMGYTFLKEFQKPSMIYDFGLKEDGTCWTTTGQDSMKGFMSYLVQNQQGLTKAGILGLFYSDYYYPNSKTSLVDVEGKDMVYTKDVKGKKFCSVEEGLDMLSGKKPVYVNYKRYETENVKCIVKNDAQVLKEKAGLSTPTLKCLDGVECELPSPLPGGKTANDYMCPPYTIAKNDGKGCKKCSTENVQVSCETEKADGTKTTKAYSVAALTDLDQDVLAALPPDLACCISDNSGQLYTYIKVGAEASYHSPDIFSSMGNKEEDCGVYADTGEVSCNANSQMLKDYKVTCKKV